MVSPSALTGYVLEELLARLIQSAGYELITNASQDPDDLDTNRAGDLVVRGRGAVHQVDALGDFQNRSTVHESNTTIRRQRPVVAP